MTGNHGEDRRAFRRLDARVSVTMTFLPSGEGAAISRDFHSLDLSPGGIRVATDAAVEPGAFVALHIALPGEGDSIELFAKVIWTTKDQDGKHMAGLQFLAGSGEGIKALEGYLEPLLG